MKTQLKQEHWQFQIRAPDRTFYIILELQLSAEFMLFENIDRRVFWDSETAKISVGPVSLPPRGEAEQRVQCHAVSKTRILQKIS